MSALGFGDQEGAFLLPGRRVFNLTDAQLFVARRDNARAVFAGHLAARGGELPAERCVRGCGWLAGCAGLLLWC